MPTVGFIQECLVCGKTFQAKRQTKKFCSDACKMKHHRQELKKQDSVTAKKSQPGRTPGLAKRVCPHCGEWFVAHRSDQVFCSKSCRSASNRIRVNETWRQVKSLTSMSDFDILTVANRSGWGFFYDQLEKWGYTYSVGDRMYHHVSYVQAQLELNRG